MENIMKKSALFLAISVLASGSALANNFVNGGFEDGNFNNWNASGAAYRASVNNTGLTPAFVYANDNPNVMHSQVINTSYTDPNVPVANLGTTVFKGNYAARVEDTTYGGYASAIEQTVTNYTDKDIFFEWKAVLLGAHGLSDAATMKLVLTDLTTNTDLVSRTYTAVGSGVDSSFSLYGSNYYTPNWMQEHIDVQALGALGHDFKLSLLASDCQPTGHWGYVYLDGFGSVQGGGGGGGNTVPEPATLAMLGLGLVGMAAARRRKAA